MAQPLHFDRTVRRNGSRGFTLVELMIVVVIVGILATLAVLGYRSLIRSSHVTEATGMVQNIRIAQEAYHAETQRYANVSLNLTTYYPAAPRYGITTGWGGPTASYAEVPWSVLPVHVDGPVLFGYATLAGIPGGDKPPQVKVGGVDIGLPQSPVADWFVISAEGDLDGDPSVNTQVYASSFSNQIFMDHEGF